MKKVLILLLMIGSLLMWGCAAAEESATPEEEAPAEEAAQEGEMGEEDSMRGTAQVTLAGKNITIEYGRPTLQGRDMIAQLEVGAPWRLGMNTATTLDTEAALTFGGATVDPGHYRLWAMKTSETEWVLIVSSSMEEFDEASEVARIPLTQGENAQPVEQFTIALEGTGDNSGTFTATWDTLKLSADFTAE
ncbi:MAG TPA: DUF2911 domain-containing protein [Acidobacteriota bacterium]|nr:DUF2911 domain-containing protein [Acidobacteriota bacterium]